MERERWRDEREVRMWCGRDELVVLGGKVEEALRGEGMDGREEDGMAVGVDVDGKMEGSGSGEDAEGTKRGDAPFAGCGVVIIISTTEQAHSGTTKGLRSAQADWFKRLTQTWQ